MGLTTHTINFEDEGKRPSLNYIQASGISSMIQDPPSNKCWRQCGAGPSSEALWGSRMPGGLATAEDCVAFH